MAKPSSSPLELVVRFSTSHQDLILPITHPFATSTLTLKQRIRAELSSEIADKIATNKLRLIHSGKVLPDTTSLGRSLNITPSTAQQPRSQHELQPDTDGPGAKSKGKLPVRDTPARVYIHCSIGDALTPSELSEETKSAQEADEALLSSQTTQSSNGPSGNDAPQHASSTTPAPRGFDRLHSAGFTPAEVAALRAQFLAIQAHTHTPDTMPSGADLLALEEQWLDSGSGGPGGGAGGEDGAGGFGSEDAGGLEDMLYGNLIGFFWPLGAMCWLMREEGVWTRRRQIAVLSGFLVNLTFGFLRVMS